MLSSVLGLNLLDSVVFSMVFLLCCVCFGIGLGGMWLDDVCGGVFSGWIVLILLWNRFVLVFVLCLVCVVLMCVCL